VAGKSSQAGAAGKRLSRLTKTKENEMHVSIDQELSRQHREEIRQEVAANRLALMAHGGREPRPYVVRDMSWRLARYLDAEEFSASAPAPSKSASGN
jgi:hypothetical protein